MDESLSKSLEYAQRLKTFNNQIKLLKEKCLENNILYTQGHQFTVDLNLINYSLTLMNIKKTNEAIFLDDYELPVKITDIKSFHSDITDLYQRNLNQYFVEYNQIVKDKGEI